MKKDLTDLIKNEDTYQSNDFISERTAADYVAKYLISYITIELQNLPKEHWESTVKTWLKIIALAKTLQNNIQRSMFYQENKFDMVMEGIMEDVIHTINGFQSINLLSKDFKPYELIKKSLEIIVKYQKHQEYQLFEEPFKYLCQIFDVKT